MSGTTAVPKIEAGATATVQVPVTIPTGVATNAYPFRAVFTSAQGTSTTPTASSVVVRGGTLAWSRTVDASFDGRSILDVSDQFGQVQALTGGAIDMAFQTTATAPAAVLLSSADPISAYRDLVISINSGHPYAEFRSGVSSYPIRISTSATVNDGRPHDLILASNEGITSLILDGQLIGQADGQEFFSQLDDITPPFLPNNPSGRPNLTIGANRAYVNGALTNRWFYTGQISSVAVYSG